MGESALNLTLVVLWSVLLAVVLYLLAYAYAGGGSMRRASLDGFTLGLLLLPPPLLVAAALVNVLVKDGASGDDDAAASPPLLGAWDLAVDAQAAAAWAAVTALSVCGCVSNSSARLDTGDDHNHNHDHDHDHDDDHGNDGGAGGFEKEESEWREQREQQQRRRRHRRHRLVVPSAASVQARVACCIATALLAASWYSALVAFLEDGDDHSSSSPSSLSSLTTLLLWSVGFAEALFISGFALLTTGVNQGARNDAVTVADTTKTTAAAATVAAEEEKALEEGEGEGGGSGGGGFRQQDNSSTTTTATTTTTRVDWQLEDNPEFASCLLSQLSYGWVRPVLDRGIKRPLEMPDLFSLVPSDHCAANARIIAAAWRRELAACTKQHRRELQKHQHQHQHQQRASMRRNNDYHQRIPSEEPTTIDGGRGSGAENGNGNGNGNGGSAPKEKNVPPISDRTSLMRALVWRGYGRRLLVMALVRLAGIAATYAQPMMLDRLLAAVDMSYSKGDDDNDDDPSSKANDGDDDDGGDSNERRRFRSLKLRLMLGYSLGLFLCNLASSVLDSQYWYWMNRLSTRARLGLMRALFAKVLVLSTAARGELGSGAIVSHLQTDCMLVSQGLVYVNQLWGLPLQILVCLALLYQQLGVAAFTGLAITAVLAPAIFVVTRAQRAARRRVMKCRDRRVKFLTELLQVSESIVIFIKVIDQQEMIGCDSGYSPDHH